MNATVFGATGFIGSHVAEQLILDGQQVVAPVRKANDSNAANDFLGSIGAVQVSVDFADDAAIAGAIEQGSTVYCCLADPRRHLALEDLRAVEVVLTCRVIAAAAHAGARRVVLLSTVMVYGFDRPARPIDESFPPRPRHPFNRVALEREQAAQAAAREHGIELALLRPANVIGRRDRQMTALFRLAQRGMFPLFDAGDARFSAIDARDTGRAMLLLGALPQTDGTGTPWLAKGYDTSWLELKAALERVTGKASLPLCMPKALAGGLGRLLEIVTPHGVEPLLTSFAVDVMTTHTLFDTTRITAAGFRPKYNLEDSLRDFFGIASSIQPGPAT